MFLKDIVINNKDNDKIAIKHLNQELSYRELYERVNYVSNKLKYCKGFSENIGIFLPNSINYVVAYFSITMTDSVIVPISVQAKRLELESIISYCELGIIITDTPFREMLINFLNKANIKVSVFNLDDETVERIGNGDCKFNAKYNKERGIDEDEVGIMLHTSGTTSKPKRVMLTHKNLISNIKSNIESLKLTQNDKTLIALPMFFGYCNTAQMLTHLYLGASIVIMDGLFMPKEFFKIIHVEKITNFTGVPTILLMILSYRNNKKYYISSLRYICFGGGNMPIEKLKVLIELFPNIGFIQTYGQTEASPRVTALLPKDSLRKIGSVGKPIPNVNVRIVNDNGKDVGINEYGEIIVQGNNVMKGYYKREDETLKVIRNGWLHTMDIGRYDEEGFIYIVGRKKNVIISGGLNIYPEEIEELLMCHPSIKDAYVFGEESEYLGEVPVAKIVLNDSLIEINEDEIKNYCVDNLANYKVPHRIVFVSELLKTSTGKIKRYEV